MNFKEQLQEKANNYLTTIKIDEEIDYIKSKMDKFYADRKFTVELIKKTNSAVPLAIGSAPQSPHYSVFIPKSIDPNYYRDCFVKEFNTLGFNETDIILTEQEHSGFISYIITLTW